jgi:hypothetical protein
MHGPGMALYRYCISHFSDIGNKGCYEDLRPAGGLHKKAICLSHFPVKSIQYFR